MISVRHMIVPKRALKLVQLSPNFMQVASITGRGTRGGPLKLQKPFPYEEKQFKWINQFFDNTMLRVSEENAKVIAIEGPIAAGKTAFAKALAEELDMIYIPEPTMDDILILPSGYDLRQHDHELSKMAQSYDHRNFCVDPKDIRNGFFRYKILCLKFFKYFDVLAHILNTGQGVVMERSYFSDYVFINAMVEQKFMSKEVGKLYDHLKFCTSSFLLPPHLVIYLDIPVPVVQERIRTRNYSYEQNSPALTKEYLASLERNWKQDYLKEASKYSEVLVYDWSDGGQIEEIVEDIEKIDFDCQRTDGRFKAWRNKRQYWFYLRKEFTNNKTLYLSYCNFPFYEAPEYSGLDTGLFMEIDRVLARLPECRFDKGYNYLMGDSILKILFSTKTYDHRSSKTHLACVGSFVLQKSK